MRYYVYSTMAAGVNYTFYAKDANGVPFVTRTIVIKGGHGVAGKIGEGHNIITPLGVRTEVTEEEYKLLETNPVFQMHKKSGCVTVETSKINPGKVSREMGLDPSRPKVPMDFPLKETLQPKMDNLPPPMPENKQIKFARP